MDKVRIIIYWLKQHKDCGLMTTCGICGSTRIQRLSSSNFTNKNGNTYKAKYKCLNCNALGSNEEVWIKTD